ncbi:MAG: hypothetical protein C4522_22070 [Desulfobacteraceae bacterium]|nr:MAG: hypothetical protein C4522_22070 [Desulfobacteraceae bacterium]
MREFGFETIFVEFTECHKNHSGDNKIITPCVENTCGKRFESCKDYIRLLEQHYECLFISKKCYRISFFNEIITDEKSLCNKTDSNLLAYCILHRDKYRKGEEVKRNQYVTESTISVRERRRNFYLSGNQITNATIAGKNFQIKGHYFSQQNDITNCCSQASIKMALRGFYRELTAEQINKLIGNDHKKNKGNRGLNPTEFKSAISKLEKIEVEVFDGLMIGPWEFAKIIYHAVESRFPVILLFSHPKEKKGNPDKWKIEGHATALIGHTFNNSNWWSYGWISYFSSLKPTFKYLPSVLWCDNFVIQDDNMGPYYRIPVSSLRVTNISSKFPPWAKLAVKAIKKDFLRYIIPFSYWPVYALIMSPAKSVDLRNCIQIENYALEHLFQYINKSVLSTIYEPTWNRQFSELLIYFMNEKMLVARTFAIRKCEYIDYFGEAYRNENMEEILTSLEIHLKSEYIWLTEISVPELFWVNKKKIGDIVCEPYKFPEQKKQLVKFIRIPSHYCFFFEDFTIERDSFKERDSRYPLVSPECNKCFI